MFHFFKNKPFLKDLLPAQHLDFHSHLLPGLDDGARHMQDSLDLLQGFSAIGIREIITSPHVLGGVWENTGAGIEDALTSVREAIAQNKLDIQLTAAAEYMLDGNFWELFKNEPLRTLKGKYVLVEMSYINPPIQLYEILFDLQVAGYKPVLAHPERYMFYHNDLSHYAKLRNAGCLFQMNLLAAVGYYGQAVTDAAQKLLKNGWMDFAGSDVHHRQHMAGFDKRVKFKDVAALQEALLQNSLLR